jgi:hypothetical protein
VSREPTYLLTHIKVKAGEAISAKPRPFRLTLAQLGRRTASDEGIFGGINADQTEF